MDSVDALELFLNGAPLPLKQPVHGAKELRGTRSYGGGKARDSRRIGGCSRWLVTAG